MNIPSGVTWHGHQPLREQTYLPTIFGCKYPIWHYLSWPSSKYLFCNIVTHCVNFQLPSVTTKNNLLWPKSYFSGRHFFLFLMTQGHTPCLTLCIFQQLVSSMTIASLFHSIWHTVTAACSSQAITDSNTRLWLWRPLVIDSCCPWWTKSLPSNVPQLHTLW